MPDEPMRKVTAPDKPKKLTKIKRVSGVHVEVTLKKAGAGPPDAPTAQCPHCGRLLKLVIGESAWVDVVGEVEELDLSEEGSLE